MSRSTPGLTSELREYMLSVSVKETETLRSLREETSLMQNSNMQISPEQGQFINFLLKLTRAEKTLEIGVFTGYSTLWTAMALPDTGTVIACDISREWTNTARKYWKLAGIDHIIDLHIGPAEETLEGLIGSGHSGTIDFAFIDADKDKYDTYYELSLSLLKAGGLMAIDNVFMHGRVLEEEVSDQGTPVVKTLNRKIFQDSRVDISMLPVGDGLTLIRKR